MGFFVYCLFGVLAPVFTCNQKQLYKSMVKQISTKNPELICSYATTAELDDSL